jgi:hypothetical protein
MGIEMTKKASLAQLIDNLEKNEHTGDICQGIKHRSDPNREIHERW